MNGDLLVLNSGSSSIKFSVFTSAAERGPRLSCSGEIENIGAAQGGFRARDAAGEALADEKLEGARGSKLDHETALRRLTEWLAHRRKGRALGAAGHRVVHGGVSYAAPVRIDDRVLGELEALVPLAPLHQPHNLAAIRVLRKSHPDLPQVACFDTGFHATMPDRARNFALPRELTAAGVRRYGFHGLSYEYIASVLPEHAGAAAAGAVVVAHLGNGASMCAMRDRRSLDTTMGFTALDGLPMGTRCGSLDPGVPLYLLQARGMNAQDLEDLLYHRSGLLGVSGISNDMRTLLASDDPHAKEAVELFVYRIGRELGALAGSLGGLDVVVFTGGIGEHAAQVREGVCRSARWLGLELDAEANRRGGPCITRPRSAVSAWVIPTDEELMIARHTQAIIGDSASTSPRGTP